MSRPLTDTEATGLVQRSALFRAARTALLMLDVSAASSAIVRALPRPSNRRALGALLLAAGVTHGALELALPAAMAPAGRFLFAAAAAIAGAILLAGRRQD